MVLVSRLPYTLAVGVTLDEYEQCSDKFNVRGYWEWVDYKVIIYELPSKPHETLIGAIAYMFLRQCDPVFGTDASIGNLGAIRKCQLINCQPYRYVCNIKQNFVFLKELAPKILEKKWMHVFALQNHECDHQMGVMDRYLILLALNSSELRFHIFTISG